MGNCKRMIALVLTAAIMVNTPMAVSTVSAAGAQSNNSADPNTSGQNNQNGGGKTASPSKHVTTSKVLPEQVMTTIGVITKDSKGNLNLSSKVTRAQFAQMLVNSSGYKDKVSKSIGTSLYKDVKKNYWAAPYIKIAVNNGWMTANIWGKFRPTSYVTLQEAVTASVALLGYTDSDFQGNKADAKMAFYESQSLNANITKTKNQTLTRKDCMNLLYNTMTANTKSGEVHAVNLGYELDANGDIDYLTLVNDKMKGPLVAASSWEKQIPFSTTNATFYKNGSKSKASSIKQYDVLYYSKSLKTIWAYDQKISGRFDSALPNRISPKEITVAGQTYKIGNQDVAYQLSTLGKYDIGDNMTILMGKDDTVVAIMAAEKTNGIIGGVVLERGTRPSTDKDKAAITEFIRMVDSTGVEHTYDCDTEKISVGDPVQISFMDGKTVVNKVELNGVTGKVDAKAEKMGSYKFADGINILDCKFDIYGKVAPSRLANITLYNADIKYYRLNGANEITDLILWDVTGDIYKYGILLNSTESNQGMNYSGVYTYDINGVQGQDSTSMFTLSASGIGPSRFEFTKGKLTGIKTMGWVNVTAISGLSIFNGSETSTLSDQVSVYLVKDGKYYYTTLSKVSDLNRYEVRAYYDKKEYSGGRIRVIEARERS